MTIQIINRPTLQPSTIGVGEYWHTIRGVDAWPFDQVDYIHYRPVQVSYTGSLWWCDCTEKPISRSHWGL